ADRVEELADGRLVAGHEREVWEHIQALHRKAAVAAEAGVKPAPATAGVTAVDTPEVEEDISRWAPPPRTG
ncbi:MAG: anti-sigma factor family protein, partial [Tepidiformaceae bacterium]